MVPRSLDDVLWLLWSPGAPPWPTCVSLEHATVSGRAARTRPSTRAVAVGAIEPSAARIGAPHDGQSSLGRAWQPHAGQATKRSWTTRRWDARGDATSTPLLRAYHSSAVSPTSGAYASVLMRVRSPRPARARAYEHSDLCHTRRGDHDSVSPCLRVSAVNSRPAVGWLSRMRCTTLVERRWVEEIGGARVRRCGEQRLEVHGGGAGDRGLGSSCRRRRRTARRPRPSAGPPRPPGRAAARARAG